MKPSAEKSLLKQAGPGIFLVSVLALAGCTNNHNASTVVAANDYRLRHPIVVTEQAETFDLPVGHHTRNLNSALSQRIAAFGQESRRYGNGRVEIQVPAGSGNEAAVHALTPKIRSALRQGGLSGGHISTRTYPVEDAQSAAPIRLSYARIKATAGPCGDWPENLGGSWNQNVDYSNFGCASQANLAAMIDNPADLLAPRAMTPGDQMRRAVVLEKHRAGEQTASEYKEGDGAAVSETN